MARRIRVEQEKSVHNDRRDTSEESENNRINKSKRKKR